MKYIKTYADNSEYEADKAKKYPHVGYIEDTKEVKYINEQQTASVGDILYYAGGKIKSTNPEGWSDSLGTPIAVVAIASSETADGKCRGVSLCNMSYKTPQTGTLGTGDSNASTNGTNLRWGKTSMDVDGIPNYTSEDNAKTDMDGKANTAALVNLSAIKNSYSSGEFANDGANYPAAFACHLFSTQGTSQGDWYLPAMGELYAGLWTNKSIVSASLAALGDKAVGLVDGGSSLGLWCWSSSEYNTSNAWYLNGNGNVNYTNRRIATDNIRVRAFAAFDF